MTRDSNRGLLRNFLSRFDVSGFCDTNEHEIFQMCMCLINLEEILSIFFMLTMKDFKTFGLAELAAIGV